MGFFGKIKEGLKKTRDSISNGVNGILNSFTKIDDELFEGLEETLVMADVGVQTSTEICDRLRKKIKETGVTDPKEIKGMMKEIISEMLGENEGLKLDTKPSVILVIGVNGVGKTTSIGKIAAKGRLHNKKNLMDELAKINRVIARELSDSSVETLLVLDAATGQNAVNQAREFKNAADITGIVLTKLDGTAKGGIIIAISNELNIPVKFVGVGEGIDDLQPFDAAEFADGIFEE